MINHQIYVYQKKKKTFSLCYSFQKCLYDRGFPVPKPYDVNRHIVIMELVRGHPLNRIDNLNGHEHEILNQLIDMTVKLLKNGIVHGDLNEFNIMIEDVNENGQALKVPRAVMIDFPQMVSVDHPEAKKMFDRDIEGIRRFFDMKFNLEITEIPDFDAICEEQRKIELEEEARLKAEAIDGEDAGNKVMNWKMDLMQDARKLGNNLQGGWAALPEKAREDEGRIENQVDSSESEEEVSEADEPKEIEKPESNPEMEDKLDSLPEISDISKNLANIRTALSHVSSTTSCAPEVIKMRVRKEMEQRKNQAKNNRLKKADRVNMRKRNKLANDIKSTLAGGTSFI